MTRVGAGTLKLMVELFERWCEQIVLNSHKTSRFILAVTEYFSAGYLTTLPAYKSCMHLFYLEYCTCDQCV